jgi:hypothetical protein
MAVTAVFAAIRDFPDWESPNRVEILPIGNPLWMSPVNTLFNAYEPVFRYPVGFDIDNAFAPVLFLMFLSASLNFINHTFV